MDDITDLLNASVIGDLLKGNEKPPTFESPYSPGDTLPRDYKNVDYQYELLMKEIKEFESHLDDEHEIALKLASFGESITIAVTHIGYYTPSLIVFDGIVNGSSATLVQHVNQLNFLMLAIPKSEPDRPTRRIGFDVSNHGE